MNKSGWNSIYNKEVTAKIHALSPVQWNSGSGRIVSGKVKQLFNDYASIKGDDGFTYIVQLSKLTKVKR